MIREGVITSVGPAKQSDKNKFWYRDISLDNGDSGNIGSRDENPDFLQNGEKLYYSIEEGKFGPRISRKQAPDQQQYQRPTNNTAKFTGKDKQIVLQSTMKAAIDWLAIQPEEKRTSANLNKAWEQFYNAVETKAFS